MLSRRLSLSVRYYRITLWPTKAAKVVKCVTNRLLNRRHRSWSLKILFAFTFDRGDTMRTLMLSEIALRHPEFDEEQRRRKLMDQLLGEALAKAVYGPPNFTFGRESHFEN